MSDTWHPEIPCQRGKGEEKAAQERPGQTLGSGLSLRKPLVSTGRDCHACPRAHRGSVTQDVPIGAPSPAQAADSTPRLLPPIPAKIPSWPCTEVCPPHPAPAPPPLPPPVSPQQGVRSDNAELRCPCSCPAGHFLPVAQQTPEICPSCQEIPP